MTTYRSLLVETLRELYDAAYRIEIDLNDHTQGGPVESDHAEEFRIRANVIEKQMREIDDLETNDG